MLSCIHLFGPNGASEPPPTGALELLCTGVVCCCPSESLSKGASPLPTANTAAAMRTTTTRTAPTIFGTPDLL